MPVPTSPPPGRSASWQRTEPAVATANTSASQGGTIRRRRPCAATGRMPARDGAAGTGRRGPVNDLLPFLDFVERHPVGSSVTGAVESYSSHGAYVTIGECAATSPFA